MLILPQEVEIRLSGSNQKHFERKGYIIPKLINKNGLFTTPKGTKIKVNVLDLPESSSVDVDVQCDYCGKKYNKKYYNYTIDFYKNKKDCCKDCKGKAISKSTLKYSYEDAVDIFINNNMKVLINKEDYKNASQLINYKCIICGHESRVSISHVLLGRGCKKCKRKELTDKQRHSFEYVNKCFEDKGCVLLSKDYINNIFPLEYICHCGNYNITSFSSFQNSYFCKHCICEIIGNNRRLNFIDVKNFYNDQGCELLEDHYVNNSTIMKYRCSCGTIDYKDFSHFQRGQRCDECLHKFRVENNTKERHPQWNHNLTDEERIIKRNYSEYREWVQKIYQRDNYTCQCCGKRGITLNAHHIESYADNPDLRLDINNGATLCEECHSNKYENSFHRIYGTHNNTKEQFIKWLKSKNNYFNEVDSTSFLIL